MIKAIGLTTMALFAGLALIQPQTASAQTRDDYRYDQNDYRYGADNYQHGYNDYRYDRHEERRFERERRERIAYERRLERERAREYRRYHNGYRDDRY